MKQRNGSEGHGSELCSGFVLTPQVLPGRDWTVILFFFSRTVATELRGPREDEGDAVDLRDTLSGVSSLGP